ncbi:transcription factor [Pseudohyphozyma bogoriensis]|nr:transcription factor [Pseudohyphozyma bogoriensis]
MPPIKRPAGEQPTVLAKGLACSRCKARKVRCSGEHPACSSCLRTARFRGHDIAQVKCAYNGSGKCSEDIPKVRKSKDHARRPRLASLIREPDSRTSSASSIQSSQPSSAASSFSLTDGESIASSLFSTPASFYSNGTAASSTASLPTMSSTGSKQQGYHPYPLQLQLPPTPTSYPFPSPTTSESHLPLSTTSSLAARRAAANAMKIDIPRSSFSSLSLSHSAPISPAPDWPTYQAAAPAAQPSAFLDVFDNSRMPTPGASTTSSLSYSVPPSFPPLTQDDFMLAPYPSPSILGSMSWGQPSPSIAGTPLPQFFRTKGGTNLSLVPEYIGAGKGVVWESPTWEVGKGTGEYSWA